jgi:hypothetical protein
LLSETSWNLWIFDVHRYFFPWPQPLHICLQKGGSTPLFGTFWGLTGKYNDEKVRFSLKIFLEMTMSAQNFDDNTQNYNDMWPKFDPEMTCFIVIFGKILENSSPF